MSDEEKALRAFAKDVIQLLDETRPLIELSRSGCPFFLLRYDDDIDGGHVRELAVKHGLLVEGRPTEQCGETCECGDYYDEDDFAAGHVICYRRTPVLIRAE